MLYTILTILITIIAILLGVCVYKELYEYLKNN